ncbi:helix-turn-helix domain-containing protein [Streptomyces sp. SCSIO ZS0520]|uniref:helix-turn-helix domain-containing protein n=1 Tax=Streptomyces sp. SCSIO ZS0520 TaxID=2892996 RepID=UPI0021D969B3|nr:helix-turn-helix transcriptional regulator [Streptomyces sp. SCSIO ZS0520]
MAETFGAALRRLRGSRSVRDVAALAVCSKSYVSDLERGTRNPTIDIATTLDRALGAEGELIALAERRGNDPYADADTLQAGLEEVLAAGPLSATSLDDMEWTVARHGRATRYRPEGKHFPELLGDFQHLRLLLAQRHQPQTRRRLTTAAARMSGLMALTLLKLGDDRAAGWWRTCRMAAAAAEDRATLSWAYAQEAYQAYYGSDMDTAIELAVRAQTLAGGLPCVGPALAAPLEARAHAQLGRGSEVVAALNRSEAALDRIPERDREDSAFGYSEAQLRFHSGNALVHLGDAHAARDQLTAAQPLFAQTNRVDLPLIGLDLAMCHAIEGDPAAAAAVGAATVLSLPVAHRSPLIIFRARDVADKVPQARELREVRELREILAAPQSSGGDLDADRDGNP